jgi:hypothetical protein
MKLLKRFALPSIAIAVLAVSACAPLVTQNPGGKISPANVHEIDGNARVMMKGADVVLSKVARRSKAHTKTSLSTFQPRRTKRCLRKSPRNICRSTAATARTASCTAFRGVAMRIRMK